MSVYHHCLAVFFHQIFVNLVSLSSDLFICLGIPCDEGVSFEELIAVLSFENGVRVVFFDDESFNRDAGQNLCNLDAFFIKKINYQH